MFDTQSTSDDEDDALIFIPNRDLNNVPPARDSDQTSGDLSHDSIGDDSLDTSNENEITDNAEREPTPVVPPVTSTPKNAAQVTQDPQTPQDVPRRDYVPENSYCSSTMSPQSEPREHMRPQRSRRPPDTLHYTRLGNPVSFPQYHVQNIACAPKVLYPKFGYPPFTYGFVPYGHPPRFQFVA